MFAIRGIPAHIDHTYKELQNNFEKLSQQQRHTSVCQQCTLEKPDRGHI